MFRTPPLTPSFLRRGTSAILPLNKGELEGVYESVLSLDKTQFF